MNLHVDLGYKKNVLYTDVDIDIPDKGVISFIGDNGSGKSTFYKTLLGIIPPLQGEIPKEFVNKIAVVSDYVNIPTDINIKSILDLLGTHKIDYAKKTYTDLHKYIVDIQTCSINKLSSGQRRLVEIYAALASGKKVIIIDEAANSLDYKNRKLFLSQVKLLSENNVLFLHTSHELEDVIYLKGRIYGLFKEQKSIKQYYGDYTVENIRKYLGCEVLS